MLFRSTKIHKKTDSLFFAEIIYFLLPLPRCLIYYAMVITIKKDTNIQEVDKFLASLQPRKVFTSKKFLGKIKWGEDALKYQKRLRNEWD